MIPQTNRRQLHEYFLDIINQYSLTQTVTSPTRTQLSVNREYGITNQRPVTSNTLDLFLTNNPLLITNTKVIPGISDHDIVLIDADLKPIRIAQPSRQIYQFSKANEVSIIADLSSLKENFFSSNSQHSNGSFINNYNYLHDSIKQIVDKHVPKKTIKNKKSLPWFSSYHKKMHRKKSKLHKKAKAQPQNYHAWARYTEQ